MYTYTRVMQIRDNLNRLLDRLKAQPELRGSITVEELDEWREHIAEYDKALEKMGRNGVCLDKGLIQGFSSTEKIIAAINQNITIIEQDKRRTRGFKRPF